MKPNNHLIMLETTKIILTDNKQVLTELIPGEI